MQSKANEVSRRGFLAACGATTAAAALPMFPNLSPQAAPTSGRWTDAATPHAAALRAAYEAEIVRFALTLEAGFRSGELYAVRDADMSIRVPKERIAHYRLEDLCRSHFGLEVEEDDAGMSWTDQQESVAHVILAASPHTAATWDAGHHSPLHHAAEAAGWDVIAYARAQRWYTPTEDECDDPAIRRPTVEV